MNPLLFLEFNEVNFPMVERYIARGKLPNFAKLIARHGYSETESEPVYERIEPWIQWVSAHTGKPFDEHQVFRLGDMTNSDAEQIWERLEREGFSVGAVSPMNAANRTQRAAFFVPDPWIDTPVTGDTLTRRAHSAICQAVNDNATGRLTLASAAWLMAFAARDTRPRSYATLLRLASTAREKKWNKAILLDVLLANSFVSHAKRHKPQFATLFLNAAAHIQHHYLFSSTVYEGGRENPTWHVAPGVDPVLEVYECYDEILQSVQQSFPNAHLMLATGLHQDPHDELTFYWRLSDHANFLGKIGAHFTEVRPLMSRDFLVTCEDPTQAQQCQQVLESCIAGDGLPLFRVDNRGDSLFVMLTYPNEITPQLEFTSGERRFDCLHADVAFVAIKNGKHNGIGYFVDNHRDARESHPRQPVWKLHDQVRDAMLALRQAQS